MIILLDQDNVLANFELAFYNIWKERSKDFPPIELNERRHFYLVDDYPEEHHELLTQIYTAPGFFLNLPIMDGAKEAIATMQELGIDVRICTTPIKQYQHCVLEKYQWVERELGIDMTRRIILTRDKTMVQGDYIIDDNPIITGQVKPTWEHIVYDQPYNKGSQGRRLTWGNWREVLGV